jgi:hypothetical protein
LHLIRGAKALHGAQHHWQDALRNALAAHIRIARHEAGKRIQAVAKLLQGVWMRLR